MRKTLDTFVAPRPLLRPLVGLWLVVFLWGLGHPAWGAKPTLTSDCIDVLGRLTTQPLEPFAARPPSDLKVDLSKKAMEGLFERAWSRLDAVWDGPRLDSVLQQLREGRPLSSESQGFLKEVRKTSSQLANLFRMADRNHRPPPELRDFGRALGQLNDHIEFKDMVGSAHWAEKVLGLSPQVDIAQLRLGFVVDGKKAVRARLDKRKKKIRKLLKRSSLTEDQFHTVRKKLKGFLTLFKLLKQGPEGKSFKVGSKFLSRLNDGMGAYNDAFVRAHIEGKDPDTRVEITRPFRRDVFQLLDQLEY